MTRRFKILPFKPDSTGAEILANNLPAEKVNPNDASSIRSISGNDVVVNWGCGWTNRVPVHANQPQAIYNAVNKLKAFDLFRECDVAHPSYTSSRKVAAKWLRSGHNVYARTTMEGERGRGITVVTPEYPGVGPEGRGLPDALVYVKGFPAQREFRIHVAFGEVIEVNEKKRRNGTNPDPLVRSSSDWVFCVYNLAPYDDSIKSVAVDAVAALGLDFGGVDLALDESNNVCVYEVNTAPWINRESSTLAYVNALKEHFT